MVRFLVLIHLSVFSPVMAAPHLPVIYHVACQNPNASDDKAATGTEINPFKSIGRALRNVHPGDVVIIHQGIYREGAELTTSGTASFPITIKAAENERVIMRGSQLVTSWERRSDGLFIHNGWPYYFGSWKEPVKDGRDAARNQLYVNGRYIEEVRNEQDLKENTFFIDKNSRQIFLKLNTKDNPLSDSIEVSNREYCLSIRAEYIVVRGIHVEYGANGPQKNAMFRVAGDHNRIENCSVEWAAGSGFSLKGKNNLIRNCKFNHNGQIGFGCSFSENCLFENCETSYNNLHDGKTYSVDWEAGGNKVALSRSVNFFRHTSVGNNGVGIWYDISNDSCEVANCFAQGNSRCGLAYEISYRLYAHDNVMIGNGLIPPPGSWGADGGISVSSSPGCVIERNILINNGEGFQFREQNRETYDMGDWSSGNLKSLNKIPVWNHDEIIRNNIIAYNRTAQVGGWFDISDGRHWPAAIRQILPGNENSISPVMEYLNKHDTVSQDIVPITLESLNIIIDNNCYWDGGVNNILFRWGVTWKYNRKYRPVKPLLESINLIIAIIKSSI